METVNASLSGLGESRSMPLHQQSKGVPWIWQLLPRHTKVSGCRNFLPAKKVAVSTRCPAKYLKIKSQSLGMLHAPTMGSNAYGGEHANRTRRLACTLRSSQPRTRPRQADGSDREIEQRSAPPRSGDEPSARGELENRRAGLQYIRTRYETQGHRCAPAVHHLQYRRSPIFPERTY